MSYRSIPTRVLNLIVQAALVLAGGLPALASGGSEASSSPSAPSTAPAAPAALSGNRSAGPASTASSVQRAGTTPASAVPGVRPARFGLVAPTPRASWIPNGQVNALATDGTYIYLAGTFTALTNPVTGLSQPHVGLGRISISTGTADATWSPSVDGTPESLAFDPGSSAVYVGGLFTTVNGSARTNLAALSSSAGAALLAFAPNPTNATQPSKGDVRALMVDQGELLVGGGFLTIAGASQKNLAKVDLISGAIDAGFSPAVNAGVFAVSQPPGTNLYAIGGAFDHLGGASHPNIGLVSRSTGATNGWTANTLCPVGIACPVLSIASTRTQIFVAASGPGGQAVAFDLSTGQRQWKISADGNVQAVTTMGSEVYFGGHFDPTFGPALRTTLASVDGRTGAIDPTFHPTAKSTFPGTEAMLTLDSGIVAAGAQLTIGGTAQSRFAIFPTMAKTATVNRSQPGAHLDRSMLG